MYGRVVSILRPQELRGIFPDFSGGVGTPYLVFNSDTGERWLLFTGWKDPVGLKREGAVAPIEKDLTVNLRKIRKILPSGTIPGRYTMNAVRGIYNPVRDEYIISVTQDREGYIFWFDSNWNKIGFKRILNGVGDSGVPFKPFGAYGYLHDAVAAIPDGAKIKLLGIRDIDEHEKVRVESYGIASWHGSGNDVLDLTLIPRISAITESDEFGKWLLKAFIGPSPSDVKGLDCDGGIPNVGLLEGDVLSRLMIDDIFVQTGHPHYATEPDGYPKLFFASFRDTWSTRRDTNKEGYVHEIYAVYVDNSLFDPRSYGILKDRIFVPNERGLPSKWYWIGPAKEILLIINRVKRGKISIRINEAASLINLEDAVATRLELLEESNKLVIENPSPFIRIESIDPATNSTWIVARY